MHQVDFDRLIADPDALHQASAVEQGPERDFRIHVRRAEGEAASSFIGTSIGPATAIRTAVEVLKFRPDQIVGIRDLNEAADDSARPLPTDRAHEGRYSARIGGALRDLLTAHREELSSAEQANLERAAKLLELDGGPRLIEYAVQSKEGDEAAVGRASTDRAAVQLEADDLRRGYPYPDEITLVTRSVGIWHAASN